MDGYELLRVTRIDRDFIEKLPVAISHLCGPMQDKKKLRVVIDYDPQENKTEFRYYRLSNERAAEEHQ